MLEQINAIEEIYKKHENALAKESEKGVLSSALDAVKGKKSVSSKLLEELLHKLTHLESTCAVCDRMNGQMDKLIDNTLYLYSKEPEFRAKFHAGKGFCLKHVRMLLEKAPKELNSGMLAAFLKGLMPLELEELKRVQGDVSHFVKMFDYRNQGADWKNSRDAVPRSIEKLSGPCDLKR